MKKSILIFVSLLLTVSVFAQQFEAKKDTAAFKKVKVNVGGDFALQYQALNHTASAVNLIPLGSGINLPTANFSINSYLAKGVSVHLTTYLSSRHHTEAWVKGGYILMDDLPFLHSDAISNLMKNFTIKVGMDEINYGDAHFRRTDNGSALKNPFVGNLIMDGFTTAATLEVMYRNDAGFLAMAGINNGTLKPALSAYSTYTQSYTEYNMVDELAFHWKLGYDKQINDDVRVRATLSGFHSPKNHFGSLYYGDRAGSRFYMVMQPETMSADDVDPSSGHTSGRWGPGFTNKNNAFMFNLFARIKGFELFGTYEHTSGTPAFGGADFKFNQFAIEGLYHFGGQEQFYAGGQYNKVKNDVDEAVSRYQLVAGWDLTKNIRLKAEYVNQTYDNFSSYGTDAGFKGFMLEGAISF